MGANAPISVLLVRKSQAVQRWRRQRLPLARRQVWIVTTSGEPQDGQVLMRLDYQGTRRVMLDVYTATLRNRHGKLETVALLGNQRSDVLYAVTELFPDCDVVRVRKDDQWDAVDGQTADHDSAGKSRSPFHDGRFATSL